MTKIKKSAVVALAVLLLITSLAFGACEEETRHASFSMLLTYGEGNKQIITFYPGVNSVYLTIDAPAAELSYYQYCVPRKDENGEWKFIEDLRDYTHYFFDGEYYEHEADDKPESLGPFAKDEDPIYPIGAIELRYGKGIYQCEIHFDSGVKNVPIRKVYLEIKLADIEAEE